MHQKKIRVIGCDLLNVCFVCFPRLRRGFGQVAYSVDVYIESLIYFIIIKAVIDPPKVVFWKVLGEKKRKYHYEITVACKKTGGLVNLPYKMGIFS